VDAYLLIVKQKRPSEREKMYFVYGAVGIGSPLVNLGITLSLASFKEEDPNYHLNALRSAFSCHPQLSTMTEEVLLLYLSTLLCCSLIFVMALQITVTVFSASNKATSVKAALKTAKRLIIMCVFVLCLFAIFLAVTIYYVGIMEDFGTAADLWKFCNESTFFQWPECANWKTEGFPMYISCLDVKYPTRFIETFEEGCGDRPENAPSVAMMVLVYAAPACVALAAPLLFGTSEKYTKVWTKRTSSKVGSSKKSTNVDGGSQGVSSSSPSVMSSGVSE